jgi:hypothetical protein
VRPVGGVRPPSLVFDTWTALMLIQTEKRGKSLACTREMGGAQVLTARELDGFKGRVLHYSAS